MWNCQRYCLIWAKSAICRESSFVKQRLIVVFCSVQQSVKWRRSIMVATYCVPHALLLHFRGMNGIRWVTLACGMLSQTSWITRHNCTMACWGGSSDLIWQSVRFLAGVEWGAGRWVCLLGYCMDCIWSKYLCKSCVRKEGRCTVTQSSLAAHRCLLRMGPRYGRRARSVNHLWWLRLVCTDIRALWRPGVSTTVRVDSLHQSHRRKYQSCDGVVPGSSPLRVWFQVVLIIFRRCLDHRIVVCGTLKRLAPSAVLKLVCSIPITLSLSTMVRP